MPENLFPAVPKPYTPPSFLLLLSDSYCKISLPISLPNTCLLPGLSRFYWLFLIFMIMKYLDVLSKAPPVIFFKPVYIGHFHTGMPQFLFFFRTVVWWKRSDWWLMKYLIEFPLKLLLLSILWLKIIKKENF